MTRSIICWNVAVAVVAKVVADNMGISLTEMLSGALHSSYDSDSCSKLAYKKKHCYIRMTCTGAQIIYNCYEFEVKEII